MVIQDLICKLKTNKVFLVDIKKLIQLLNYCLTWLFLSTGIQLMHLNMSIHRWNKFKVLSYYCKFILSLNKKLKINNASAAVICSIPFWQGLYNPYVGQHQPQMFGLPGTVNTNLPYGQMSHPSPGSLGYRPVQGFLMPSPQIVQYGRPSVSGATAETIPANQVPYLTGITFVLPNGSSLLFQGNFTQSCIFRNTCCTSSYWYYFCGSYKTIHVFWLIHLSSVSSYHG